MHSINSNTTKMNSYGIAFWFGCKEEKDGFEPILSKGYTLSLELSPKPKKYSINTTARYTTSHLVINQSSHSLEIQSGRVEIVYIRRNDCQEPGKYQNGAQ